MSGPARYRLSVGMAAWVRRLREGGATWTEIADRLHWPLGNAQQNIEGALARADEEAEATDARSRAEAEAERDPILSRRCAECGAPNYTLVKDNSLGFVALPVGFVRLGGRWLCARCAPRRRMAPDVCPAFAVPYGPAK